MKNIIIGLIILCIGMAGAYLFLQSSSKETQKEPQEQPVTDSQQVDLCNEHKIAEAKCPWCNPALIEQMGECAEHKVPEALCSRCNPDLIAGFKAENDWCNSHNVPESQCDICKSGDIPSDEKENN